MATTRELSSFLIPEASSNQVPCKNHLPQVFTSSNPILAKVENKGGHFHQGKADFHILTTSNTLPIFFCLVALFVTMCTCI